MYGRITCSLCQERKAIDALTVEFAAQDIAAESAWCCSDCALVIFAVTADTRRDGRSI